MDPIMSIHEAAISALSIKRSFFPKPRNNRARREQLRAIVCEVWRDWPAILTTSRHRDYRGFQRDGRRVGPGSGRTADWLDIGFEHYSVIAQTLHRDTGWSGELIRRLTRQIHRQRMALGQAGLSSFPSLPETVVLVPFRTHVYRKEDRSQVWRFPGDVIDHPGRQLHRWQLYVEWNIGRAIGEYDAAKRLHQIAENSEAKTSGYLVDSILSWQAGKQGYEGCSGCESYEVHRLHPEHWPLLLSCAPVGAKGDGWEQVFPHERERIADLEARGWFHTMRMNDSIYTERNGFEGERKYEK